MSDGAGRTVASWERHQNFAFQQEQKAERKQGEEGFKFTENHPKTAV